VLENDFHSERWKKMEALRKPNLKRPREEANSEISENQSIAAEVLSLSLPVATSKDASQPSMVSSRIQIQPAVPGGQAAVQNGLQRPSPDAGLLLLQTFQVAIHLLSFRDDADER
jgi:hypothetical protein